MSKQSLKKVLKDPFEVAQKYFQIISVINDLKLADGEIQFIAFAAIRGNMADHANREEYCERYDTTAATINNVVYRLKPKYIIIKKDKEIRVNPQLTLVDFDKPLTIETLLEMAPQESYQEESTVKNDSNIKG